MPSRRASLLGLETNEHFFCVIEGLTMDAPKTTTITPPVLGTGQNGVHKNGRGERKRRWEMTPADVRFFLPKSGTTADKPELGRELPSEGEALVESFRTGQVFFTLVAWKAVHEMDDDTPRIVKDALKRT